MSSFIENINVDFDIQPKKEKKKRHWKNYTEIRSFFQKRKCQKDTFM